MIAVRTLRIIRWIALALIVLLASGVAFIAFGPKGSPQRQASTNDASGGIVTITEGISIGGPFKLIDDKGRAVTDVDYRGRWVLVFFGYTNCPDECPLTLQKIATSLNGLGPLADGIAPLFITVDPVRDTPRRLADYLTNFDARIVGLTGSDDQIAAAAEAFRVYYVPAEHEQSGADIVSHSTFLYLMSPSGKLDTLFSPGISDDQLTATLRERLSSSKHTAQPS